MLEDFEKLADAMIKLKKAGQLDQFNECCNFDSAYQIPDANKSKLMAAIAGLDDVAYGAIDELKRLGNG